MLLWVRRQIEIRYAAEGSRPEAVRWLLAAAEQGLPRAQIKLAEMYAGEPEMPDSAVRACEWILLATASLRGAQLQGAQPAYQRACMGFLSGRDRIGQVLCATLEAVAADRRALLEPQKSPEGASAMIKNWFVPPIVIPILIVLGLLVYVTVHAFH